VTTDDGDSELADDASAQEDADDGFVVEDDGVLDTSDTLDDDLADPLDTGVIAADRRPLGRGGPVRHDRRGRTPRRVTRPTIVRGGTRHRPVRRH
jgi:hypothetical protein